MLLASMEVLAMLLALVGGLQCRNCVFRVVTMPSAMPICCNLVAGLASGCALWGAGQGRCMC